MSDKTIPPALLEAKLDIEYDDQDRRGLLAIIGTHKKYLRQANDLIKSLSAQNMKQREEMIARLERAEKAEQRVAELEQYLSGIAHAIESWAPISAKNIKAILGGKDE